MIYDAARTARILAVISTQIVTLPGKGTGTIVTSADGITRYLATAQGMRRLDEKPPGKRARKAWKAARRVNLHQKLTDEKE